MITRMEQSQDNETFGARLRRLRKNRGKTMGQLARNVGISVIELSVIETSRKVPQSKLVDWMAGYLNVAVEELTGELPPELIAHQAEVKAEVKARYMQRHGRDTLLQMRSELLQRMAQGQVVSLDEVKDQDELLSWMDEKLCALDSAR